MNKLEMIDYLLLKADDEFRGGDPEEIRLKREEKELDLGKAEPGQEPGAFRGGDPEEIRLKREEKMQEREDAGEFEDQGDSGEEPTQEEIEEVKQEDEQKREDQGKSLMHKAAQILSQDVLQAGSARQVSPVDTFGDYRPRDANGTPLDVKYADQVNEDSGKYVAPGPIRAGENQHKNWSDVLGIRIPLTGEPVQHLRRFWKQGQYDQMDRESRLLARSLEGQLGILWCWRPDFFGGEFYKGIGTEPKPGHKYVKRWWDNNRWNYEYSEAPHPKRNGIIHSNNMAGYTMPIPASYWERDKTPTPEEAYQYSAHMQVAYGGTHRIQIWDSKSSKPVDKILHMPGSKRDKDGKFILDKNGLPIISPKTSILLKDPEGDPNAKGQALATLETLRRKISPITTEYDAYGDPWIHWKSSTKGTDSPWTMLDPKSRLNAGHPLAGKWNRRTRNVENLREWIANQLALQHAIKEEEERGVVPPEERKPAKEWEPVIKPVWEPNPNVPGTFRQKLDEQGNPVREEAKITNALERGDLGVWKWKKEVVPHTVSARRKGDEYGEIGTKTIFRKQPVLNFDSIHDRNKVQSQVFKENLPSLLNTSFNVFKQAGLGSFSGGKPSPELHREALSFLYQVYPKVFERSVNRYNPNHPSKARFSTFLNNNIHKEMLKELPSLLESSRELKIKEYRATPASKRTRAEATVGLTPKQLAIEESKAHRVEPTQVEELRQKTREAKPSLTEVFGEAMPSESEMSARNNFIKQFQETVSPEDQRKFVHHMKTNPAYRYHMLTSAQGSPLYEHVYEQLSGEKLPGIGKVGKSLASWWADASSLLEAVTTIRKASEDYAPSDDSGMKYLWREGEPGAAKYMWEDPQGNVVRGTNAPEGHPHHDPSAGSPQVHPSEPTMQTAPHMFDDFGRKLHRPAPEGTELEMNPTHDPDVNHWAYKYADPETGGDEFISLHRDRIKNHRYALNEDIRHVDAQLEKIRRWYDGLLKKSDLRNKAVGLIVALLDQGRIALDGLVNVQLKDVSLVGNTLKIKYRDENGERHAVVLAPDSVVSAVFHELSRNKSPNDILFSVEGQPISREEIAQILDAKFGVTPKQFRTYHGTEMFSKEFQKIVARTPNLTPEMLPKIADQAYGRVMRMLGHQKVDFESSQRRYVDPIVVEALYMAAIHHHDPELNKSLEKARKLHGKTIFQGLPVSVENRKGSVRKWYDPHTDNEGSTKMQYAYGYIRGTEGVDGDQVDVFIGPDKNSDKVFVIHQKKAPDFKEFDEDKCMLGFSTGTDAKEAYLKHYDDPRFFGSMSVLPMEDFKEKVFKTKQLPKMIKSSDADFKPHSPTQHTPSEPGYVYHATNEENAHSIAGDSLHIHKPWHGTDQSAWPDGSTKKRSYWSEHAHHVHSFAPAEGKSVILRTKPDQHFKKEKFTKDVFTEKPVHSNKIEIMHESGSWHPLNHAYGVKKSIMHCSLCKELWGSCSHSKEIEKSFKENLEDGPFVWSITVSQPKRTPDEKMFGDWIHSHPMHEHDQHWAAFREATGVENPVGATVDREYADGGTEPSEAIEDEEPDLPADNLVDEDAGTIDQRNVAKSFLDDLIRMAG